VSRSAHCIGIGGIGLSGLAKCLAARGWRVSGCDQKGGAAAEALAEAGVAVRIGHDAAHLRDRPDVVVRSAAISDGHPEVAAARAAGIEVVKYAEMLGRLMAEGEGIAVSGCHGKTTTSGWIAYLLDRAGLDPSFVVGGVIPHFGSNSRAGGGRHFVAEACEFDRSFHHLKPRIAVITNIEEDHLDYYKDLKEIVEAFGVFAAAAPVVVGCADNPWVAEILTQRPGAARSYALERDALWRARDVRVAGGRWRFEALREGRPAGRFTLEVPGLHNVSNALAVLAVGTELGIAPDAIAGAVEGYGGAARRFQTVGERRGVTVIDDYAHHPTEIASVLAAARARFAGRPVWCVFQPHQHSRTRQLLDAFPPAFDGAAQVLLPDIYFARDSEEERRKVTSGDLAERLRGRGIAARHLPAFDGILDALEREIPEGAVLITMGAGNVGEVAERFVGRGNPKSKIRNPN
jgi:UDP-N-acetylmuramate--alanine ligase